MLHCFGRVYFGCGGVPTQGMERLTPANKKILLEISEALLRNQ